MLQERACSQSVWYGKAIFFLQFRRELKQKNSFSLQVTPEKFISPLKEKCHTV